MSRVVVTIVALLILSSGGAIALQASLESGGEQTEVTNESFSVVAGDVTTLDDSNKDVFYAENVTVRNGSLDEVQRGSDYKWFAENGTIRPVAGGDLDGSNTGYINYSYSDPTHDAEQMATLLAELPRFIGLAIPAFVAILLIGVFTR